jgi:plastocyanin
VNRGRGFARGGGGSEGRTPSLKQAPAASGAIAMQSKAGLLAAGVVLAVLVLATAPAGAQERNATIGVGEQADCPTPAVYCFEPPRASVGGGGTVTLTLANDGNVAHSLCVEVPADDPCTPDPVQGTPAGESSTVSFPAPAAGMYRYYCAVPGHVELGMVGNLTVAAAAGTNATTGPGAGMGTGPTNATGGEAGRSTPWAGAGALAAAAAVLALGLRGRRGA